jgi:deaminated glutathione amidase
MKVAAIQMNSNLDSVANVSRAINLMSAAVKEGAGLIVLPEVFNSRGEGVPAFERAEPIPGPSLEPLMAFAKKHKIAIIAGSMIEAAPKGKPYNTSVVIDGKGKITTTYRKINLFESEVGAPPIKESDYFQAGDELALVDINTWRVGLTICFDLRFPELFGEYRRAGAHIIVVPSAFTATTGAAHWETLLRARAIETQSYIIAPNQVGPGAGGLPSYGNSMIIDPWGEIMAQASSDQPEVIVGELTKTHIKKIRRRIPMGVPIVA